MKLKKLFFIIFSFIAFNSYAEKREYSSQDYANIDIAVRNAFHAKAEDLQGTGPFKMQVLSQAVTGEPDPKKYPFIGYGKTLEEAQVRAGLMCMKWQCEIQSQKVTELIESWKTMPAEKLMDYFNATGRLEEFPAAIKSDPETFKAHIFSKNFVAASCETFNTYQLSLIYVQCAAAGAMVISNSK